MGSRRITVKVSDEDAQVIVRAMKAQGQILGACCVEILLDDRARLAADLAAAHDANKEHPYFELVQTSRRRADRAEVRLVEATAALERIAARDYYPAANGGHPYQIAAEALEALSEPGSRDAGEEPRTQVEGRASRRCDPGSLNAYADECHTANAKWWHREDGSPIERNKGELLMLMVSEIAEAMEGERKSLPDDKLPHRPMAEVELADTLIRIFDYAAAFGYDLDGAYVEKMAYNARREDHTHEARALADGKKW